MTVFKFWDSSRGDVPIYVPPYGAGGGAAFSNRQVNSTGIFPGATAQDNVLAVFTIPVGSFDVAGHGLQLTCAGSFGANGNNKRIKIIVGATSAIVGSAVSGGTTVADSGTITSNGSGWLIQAEIYKTGISGSNTQLGIHLDGTSGAGVSMPLLVPTPLTMNEALPQLVCVTGNAGSVVTDIALNYFEVATD